MVKLYRVLVVLTRVGPSMPQRDGIGRLHSGKYLPSRVYDVTAAEKMLYIGGVKQNQGSAHMRMLTLGKMAQRVRLGISGFR